MPFRFDPGHWRERAKQMRDIAESVPDEQAKRLLRDIADDYEELAKKASVRKGQQK
jgi:hypothetical protein